MKKKVWYGAIALLAISVVLAVAIFVLLPPTPGVTYANYSRIEKGMTRDDVIALLGSTWMEGPPMRWQWQSADDHDVWVDFDHEGRVVRSAWNGIAEERSDLERLRDRLPFVARKPPRGKCMEILQVW